MQEQPVSKMSSFWKKEVEVFSKIKIIALPD
jgi:hypothetical protein